LSYFNLNYVTNPPNDELVDINADLNNNWEEIGNKLHEFNTYPSNITAPSIGSESFYPVVGSESTRMTAWTGTEWIRGINHAAGFTVWQAIDLRPPVVARTGQPVPAAIIDTYARRVTCSGVVVYGVSEPVWPTGLIEITTDLSIATGVGPVNGRAVEIGCVGNNTISGIAAAVLVVTTETTPPRVSIKVKSQGPGGGGNFISLDGLSWSY
jgi:hypothetical protein